MQQNQPKNDIVVAPYDASRKVRQTGTYEQFIVWSALPGPERKRLGIETQEDFAKFYGCGERTLNRWKSLEDYRARVRDIRDKWAFGRTSNVINAIYVSAMKGDARSQLLWMQYFEGFDPHHKRNDLKKEETVLSINDIRFMVEQLPNEKKQKYYGFLRDLLCDISDVKFANDVELRDTDGDAFEQLQGAVRNEAQCYV